LDGTSNSWVAQCTPSVYGRLAAAGPDRANGACGSRDDRKRLEAETKRAQATTAIAVQQPIKRVRLSLRDARDLLGISRQRVQQLADNE